MSKVTQQYNDNNLCCTAGDLRKIDQSMCKPSSNF